MILICAVLENMVSKGLCACVKTWITCWSWSVLLATDSNSTVLHFDSLNKPDLSWPCGPVAVQSLTQSLSKIQWDPLFRLFACYYALCFFRNQHTYPKSFTIVWSSICCIKIFLQFISLLAHLYESTRRAIAVTTASALESALLEMLKFLVKVFKNLYLLNPWMNLFDTLPDVRYWSEVLCCTIMTHITDLEVKVMDFEILS